MNSKHTFSCRNAEPPHTLRLCLVLLVCAGFFSGCKSTYYGFMEKVGKPKRELLRSALDSAKENQEAANEQFKETLFQLKEVYQFDGGELEKKYNAFKSNFDKSKARADAVKSRIDRVETIGGDLFAEWESEIEQISSSTLRSDSRAKLQSTQDRFQSLLGALHQSERRMPPLIERMNDYVLYLKHNLNAQAIGSFEQEAELIEKEILLLISDMNKSILETEEFIQSMDTAP